MGKGARSRIKYAEKNEQKKIEQAKVEKKQKVNKFVAIIATSVAAVVLIASSLVYSFYYANGEYLRKTTVAQSASASVDNAMFLYYFNQTLSNYQSYYGDYFEALTGIDLTKSLKNQVGSDGTSWFDTILSSSKSAVEELLILADAANEAGFTLSDTVKDGISKRVDEANISSFNGKLNKDDLRRCLELTALASMYRNYLTNEVTPTDTEVDEYFAEDPNNFMVAGYRRYTVSYAADDDEESTLPKQPEAQVLAYDLEAATSEAEFIEKVTKLLTDANPELTEEEIQTRIDNTLVTDVSYGTDSELLDWVFAADTKIGDTYVYTTESSSSYTVYMLTASPAKNEDPTVNAAHILIGESNYNSTEEAKARAEEILAIYNSGDKSLDSFRDLASAYSDDTGSMYNGGVYTNVPQGQMVTEFNDWIFDSARNTGDVEIVKTSYGYHIMYYISAGEPVWKSNVVSAIKNEKYQVNYTTLSGKNQVTIYEDKMDDIPA